MSPEETAPPKFTQDFWSNRHKQAVKFMEERAQAYTKTLIEVAAQHPLVDGEFPNEEFRLRLERAIELYNKAVEQGVKVEFYVPGNLHMHEGVIDKISLAKAGTNFLLSKGISPEIVHGEDLNEKYKGEDGVYNSADECFVTAQYFKDGNFGRLITVESPLQTMRKDFHYMYFGVWPQQHTAPAIRTFHSPVKEAYVDIPNVRDKDPGCQEISPETYAWTTRMDRMPGFKEKHQQ